MLTAGRLKRIKSYISPSNGNQSTSILNKFCCELVDEVERLKRLAEIKDRNSLARNLCPDHRDKQQGKPCLACEVERLKRQLADVLYTVDISCSLLNHGKGEYHTHAEPCPVEMRLNSLLTQEPSDG